MVQLRTWLASTRDGLCSNPDEHNKALSQEAGSGERPSLAFYTGPRAARHALGHLPSSGPLLFSTGDDRAISCLALWRLMGSLFMSSLWKLLASLLLRNG